MTPGDYLVYNNEEKSEDIIVLLDFPNKISLGEEIIFDSSDTVEIDGRPLKFDWDFGDGAKNILPSPSHVYFSPGEYAVKLAVSNGEKTVVEERIIEVATQENSKASKKEDGQTNVAVQEKTINLNSNSGDDNNSIWINELLPDPEGSDDLEWIEFFNFGNKKVDLNSWKLVDKSQADYLFVDTWLDPGNYLVLDRSASKIALNNTSEALTLFNHLNEVVNDIEYDKAIKGESFARGEDGKYFWTTILTPGKANVIKVSDSQTVRATSIGISNTKKVESAVNDYLSVSLGDLLELEEGSKVKVAGTVAVLPGILGAQYFYIIGSPGAQVYNYQKDFPKLAVGDVVEVSGELSFANDERRVKISSRDDIIKISDSSECAVLAANCDSIKGNVRLLGSLVEVGGEVVKKSGSTVVIDDGLGEISVYIKPTTEIKMSLFKIGDQLSVVGILTNSKAGERIMPRSLQDIKIKKIDIEDSEEMINNDKNNQLAQVLGEVVGENDWGLPGREKDNKKYYYFIILGGIIVAVLGYFLVKKKR